jgi:hypothetical protein
MAKKFRLPNYLHKYTVPEVLVEQSGSVHLVACNFTWLCNVFRTELIMKLLFWILKSVISYEGELDFLATVARYIAVLQWSLSIFSSLAWTILRNLLQGSCESNITVLGS